MVKYFSRPNKVLDGKALRKMQLRHVVELQKQQMHLNLVHRVLQTLELSQFAFQKATDALDFRASGVQHIITVANCIPRTKKH